MTLTRQHFALIAEVFADARPKVESTMSRTLEQTRAARDQWERMAYHMSTKLRATNPNFNPSRFLKACGVEG